MGHLLFCTSGNATGDGPRRQIISEALDEFFADAATFCKLSDEGAGYYGPAICDPGTTTRAQGLKLAGFLVALGLRWIGSIPLRLSPCVLLATFKNSLDGIYHPTFLEKVLPETASKLHLWDRYAVSPFQLLSANSPDYMELSSLAVNHLHLQVYTFSFSCYINLLLGVAL